MKREMFNEREIIYNLKVGDREAFRMLYEKYAPRLKSFSTRFNFSVQESEDIVQESFIKIWLNRATINPEASFNTYLITIAKHLIYNQIRHKAYQDKYKKSVSQSQPEAEIPGNEKDLQSLIEQVVAGLPDACRRIYKKSRVDGYSNLEIAKELNISKSTVENQLNKALNKIKATLKDAGYGAVPIFILGIGLYECFFKV